MLMRRVFVSLIFVMGWCFVVCCLRVVFSVSVFWGVRVFFVR